MYSKVKTLYGRPRAIKEAGWESRIGGRPWGFPSDAWPRTPSGEAMPFLGQILLEGLPETAYLFMMQTYDEDAKCINETWDLDQGLSAALFITKPGVGLTEGPHIPEISAIDWIEGWSYDFDNLDGNTDEQFDLLDEEAEQDCASDTKIGGGARWLQGGTTPLPRDSSMKFVLSISSEDFPQLGKYFDMAYVFRSADEPSKGAIVWECS